MSEKFNEIYGGKGSGGSGSGTPDDNSITNAKLAQVPALTLKGNNTLAIGNVKDLTVAEVKAMLDITGGYVPAGTWDASVGTFPTSSVAGYTYIVDTAGIVDGIDFEVNDRLVSLIDNASTTVYALNWFKEDHTEKGLVGTKEVDETNIGDNKIIVYNAISGKYELQDKPLGNTDLSISNKTNTTFQIDSSTGANVTLPEAIDTEAGLLSGSNKVKYDTAHSSVYDNFIGIGSGDLNINDEFFIPNSTDVESVKYLINGSTQAGATGDVTVYLPENVVIGFQAIITQNEVAGKFPTIAIHPNKQGTDQIIQKPDGTGDGIDISVDGRGCIVTLQRINSTQWRVVDYVWSENVLATKTDLANKIDTSEKGSINGVAQLDGTGKVPSAQLPAYVDDVLEFADLASFPVAGETGKIYVALDTNKTYRWTGSTYIEISEGVQLGETSTTAYRGDRGKIAYDHSQVMTTRGDLITKDASNLDARLPIGTAKDLLRSGDSGDIEYKEYKAERGAITGVTTIAKAGYYNIDSSIGSFDIILDTSIDGQKEITLVTVNADNPITVKVTSGDTLNNAVDGTYTINQLQTVIINEISGGWILSVIGQGGEVNELSRFTYYMSANEAPSAGSNYVNFTIAGEVNKQNGNVTWDGQFITVTNGTNAELFADLMCQTTGAGGSDIGWVDTNSNTVVGKSAFNNLDSENAQWSAHALVGGGTYALRHFAGNAPLIYAQLTTNGRRSQIVIKELPTTESVLAGSLPVENSSKEGLYDNLEVLSFDGYEFRVDFSEKQFFVRNPSGASIVGFASYRAFGTQGQVGRNVTLSSSWINIWSDGTLVLNLNGDYEELVWNDGVNNYRFKGIVGAGYSNNFMSIERLGQKTVTGSVIVPTPSVSGGSAKNYLVNGSLNLWQRGSSIVLQDGISQTTADMWLCKRQSGTANATIQLSPVSGINALRVVRNAGDVNTSSLAIANVVDSLVVQRDLAGESVCFSGSIFFGANFSASNAKVHILESAVYDDSASPFGFLNITSSVATGTVNAVASSTVDFSINGVVSASAKSLMVVVDYDTPTGTALAEDSFSLYNAQLEIGTERTSMIAESYEETLSKVLPYFQRIGGVDVNEYLCTGYIQSASEFRGQLTYYQKRRVPTLSFNSSPTVYRVDSSVNATASSISSAFIGTTSSGLLVGVAGLTAGNGAILRALSLNAIIDVYAGVTLI